MVEHDSRFRGLLKTISYSYRSATIGSTLEALRAGERLASNATTANNTVTVMKVAMSIGSTLKRRLFIRRVAISAPSSPNTIPPIAMPAPSAKTIRKTLAWLAPSAMRNQFRVCAD